MDPIKLLSTLALLVPPTAISYEYLRGRKEKAFMMLSTYFLLIAVVYGLKFAFTVPRPGGDTIDPFAFPSFHAALSAALIPFYPHILTVLYAIVTAWTRLELNVHRPEELVVGFVIGILMPFAFKWLRNRIGKEADRQSFHMGAAVFFGFLLFINRIATIILFFCLLLIGVILYFNRRGPVKDFLDRYDRDHTGRGAFTLVGGLLITALLWEDAWKAAFFVAYVDGFATIAGKLKGTRGKSVVGAVGGLLGGIFAALCAKINLFIAPTVAVIELVSPVDDNIVIPFAIYVLVTLLSAVGL